MFQCAAILIAVEIKLFCQYIDHTENNLKFLASVPFFFCSDLLPLEILLPCQVVVRIVAERLKRTDPAITKLAKK